MDNWIVILSFTYPHEAHIAKSKLESEGIEVKLRDELTVQVNNFYANAIGGVKLMVSDPDYKKAAKILQESGYIPEQPDGPGRFLVWFDKATSKLPLIGRPSIELRLVVVAALIIGVIAIIGVLLSLPSMSDKLTGDGWCIDSLLYKGQKLSPYTSSAGFDSNYDNCMETIYFENNGIVRFPGINKYNYTAYWKLSHDSLYVTPEMVYDSYFLEKNLQTLIKNDSSANSVYLGVYSVKIENYRIRMQSDRLIIIGKASFLIN